LLLHQLFYRSFVQLLLLLATVQSLFLFYPKLFALVCGGQGLIQLQSGFNVLQVAFASFILPVHAQSVVITILQVQF
jgi:hypothetical protein